MMKKKLLIGTQNPAKIKRWSQYFDDMFDVVSLKDCCIDIEVEESLDDLNSNSIKKATTYANLSGLLTLSEDTGFFIDSLGGEPGPAVRRWGGQIPNDINDQDFLEFFKKKIEYLDDTRSYFEYIISIAVPDGKVYTLSDISYGYIDKQKLNNIIDHEAGYPLSKCFVSDYTNKTRFESNEQEKRKRDEEIIQKIKATFEKIICNRPLK